MLCGERGIKGFDAQGRCVRGEALLIHDRERAKASDVPVVERSRVRELERDGRVSTFILWKAPRVIDQQSAGETRLNNDAIPRRQVDHDQLRATPASLDRCSRYP